MTYTDLIKYSQEHLNYEIEMLLELSDLAFIKQSDKTKSQWAHKMALIESWVLHLRNLLEFFNSSNIRNDDVRAVHFLPANITILPLTRRLEEAKKRADKELAHLTEKRQFGTPESKKWSLDLLNDLGNIIKDFNEKADNNRLAKETTQILCKFTEIYLDENPQV